MTAADTATAERACGGDTTRSVLASWRDRPGPSSVNSVLTPDSHPAGVPGVEWVRPGSREDRARQPRAKTVLRDVAVEFGVCVRPVLLRRTDTATGETTVVETPCGSTRDKQCPPCAKRARALRAQQCREGWHLTEEPDLTPDPGDAGHRDLVKERADLVDAREQAVEDAALDPDDQGKADVLAAVEQALAELDEQLAGKGVKGRPEPDAVKRRARSTRRRHDVPDLPKIPATASTLGRTYADPVRGIEFRPSMFLTVTLPSYGPVRDDGTPVDPTTYDYARAAKDALHFGKGIDRLAQNLRRVAGYQLQYFGTVEPQRRLAPHAHFAIRGTLPRAVVKQVVAASYSNVWWPSTDRVVYDGVTVPVWDPGVVDDQGATVGGYTDPGTGTVLPTWEQAMDDLDAEHAAAGEAGEAIEPLHCVRFGTQVDVKGVLAGSPEADRLLGYLVKYLVKDLGDDLGDDDEHTPDPTGARLDTLTDGGVQPSAEASDGPGTDAPRVRRRARTPEERASAARRADHRTRLVAALRHEPCSPRCANWLRYGIQPKGAKPGLRPGACKGKAHRPSHLGYGGRRVLTSRKWTGKDLTDHRHDRKAHVLAVLGKTDELTAHLAGDPHPGGRHIAWELARPTDPDVAPAETRLYLAVAKRVRQRNAYRAAHAARDHDDGAPLDSSASDPAA